MKSKASSEKINSIEIKHQLFHGMSNIGKPKEVEIDLFPLATLLYQELENEHILTKLKYIPQLGSIKTKKEFTFSRYDYVMFQLYLYDFIRSNLKSNLLFSLNNLVKSTAYNNLIFEIKNSEYEKVPTIADILQILAISSNIGHFKNTFTASRAAINILKTNKSCYINFLNLFKYEEHKKLAIKIIDEDNYHRFHLLNSLIILTSLDENNISVKLAINVLTNYLSEDETTSEKLRFVFNLFRRVRNVAFVTYDLIVAPVPIYIDISSEKKLTIFLRELLSNYNNKMQINNLFLGLQKLLQDTVYNENDNVIIQYLISKKIENKCLKNNDILEQLKLNYISFIGNGEALTGVFNDTYPRVHDFDSSNILKLTFSAEEQIDVKSLANKLYSISFVRAAWYNRKEEDSNTLVVAISKNCIEQEKTAFKVIKMLINIVYSKRVYIMNYHNKMLLINKFFLYYLFKEHYIELIGTLNRDICVSVERGKTKRLDAINKLLKENQTCGQDSRHEIDFLAKCLSMDLKNDIAITICSSIVVKDKSDTSKKKNEFDGLIIYPNRDEEQILFVESKNRTEQPGYSKKCLKIKFDSLNIKCDEENIIIDEKDCYYRYTINK